MNNLITEKTIINITEKLFGSVLHKKQVTSMASAIFGIMGTDKLSSSAIGRTLSHLKGLNQKHAIKQVNRLFGNSKLDLNILFAYYVPWVIGSRRNIVISMDWTEYGYMGQQRLAINLITKHGRATPLLWKTYFDKEIKGKRNTHEKDLLYLLKTFLPSKEISVTVLADRGFSNKALYQFMDVELGWKYVIRIKKNTYLEYAPNAFAKASDLLYNNGRVRHFSNVRITQKSYVVPSVTLVKRGGMQEAWYLVSNHDCGEKEIISLYSRRFTCEEQFRDEKDSTFGLGFKDVIVTTTARRDRFLLVHGIATILLTLLGSVSEDIGYDRMIKANTSKKRTHSLFRQGRECFKGVSMYVKELFVDNFHKLLKNQAYRSEQMEVI